MMIDWKDKEPGPPMGCGTRLIVGFIVVMTAITIAMSLISWWPSFAAGGAVNIMD